MNSSSPGWLKLVFVIRDVTLNHNHNNLDRNFLMLDTIDSVICDVIVRCLSYHNQITVAGVK